MRSTDDMRALTRRCDGLIRLLFATAGVMWFLWFMIWTLGCHGGISLAQVLFRVKHPDSPTEQVIDLGIGDIGYHVARNFTNFAFFGVVLPATVMLLAAWLKLRRLRKQIARKKW